MAKKVFKGWCSAKTTVKKMTTLEKVDDLIVLNKRHAKGVWLEYSGPGYWPPKRVTVTVEVEE